MLLSLRRILCLRRHSNEACCSLSDKTQCGEAPPVRPPLPLFPSTSEQGWMLADYLWYNHQHQLVLQASSRNSLLWRFRELYRGAHCPWNVAIYKGCNCPTRCSPGSSVGAASSAPILNLPIILWTSFFRQFRVSRERNTKLSFIFSPANPMRVGKCSTASSFPGSHASRIPEQHHLLLSFRNQSYRELCTHFRTSVLILGHICHLSIDQAAHEVMLSGKTRCSTVKKALYYFTETCILLASSFFCSSCQMAEWPLLLGFSNEFKTISRSTGLTSLEFSVRFRDLGGSVLF
jgi:hypothetical protein